MELAVLQKTVHSEQCHHEHCPTQGSLEMLRQCVTSTAKCSLSRLSHCQHCRHAFKADTRFESKLPKSPAVPPVGAWLAL